MGSRPPVNLISCTFHLTKSVGSSKATELGPMPLPRGDCMLILLTIRVSAAVAAGKVSQHV